MSAQKTKASSKISGSSLSRVTSRRRSSTKKTPSDKSHLTGCRDTASENKITGSVEPIIVPTRRWGWLADPLVTFNNVKDFFHIENFSNASEDDAMFLNLLLFEVVCSARRIAADGGGKYIRAYEAFKDGMDRVASARIELSYRHDGEVSNDGRETDRSGASLPE